jgi:transcription elongation factor Elf1
MKELKMCPFCDGHWIVYTILNLEGAFYTVKCEDCLYETSKHTTEQEAINEWNNQEV